MNRSPMRPCGKRYATKAEAVNSKRGRGGGFFPIGCRDGCKGWHLRRTPVTAGITIKPAKDTGPDRRTRALVLDRDGYACVSCGKPAGPGFGPYSLQHRLARGHRGGNSPSNLIVLCGSATSPGGCHLRAEQRDREMQARGYWLESWQDPEAEGVMYFSEHGSGFTAWLLPDGSLSFDEPERGVA